MTPDQFIAKWRASTRGERAACQDISSTCATCWASPVRRRFALPLEKDDIALLQRCESLDWAEIDPSIFGPLFERAIDSGLMKAIEEMLAVSVAGVVICALLSVKWPTRTPRRRPFHLVRNS